MNIPVRIIHETDDPICPRISLGGKETDGFYLVYRGDREKVMAILRQCTKAFEAYQTVPEEAPRPYTKKEGFGGS